MLLALLLSTTAGAASLSLSTLTPSQLEDVTATFAAALAARPLEPASNAQRFAVGVVAAEHSTVRMASSNASSTPILPSAQLVGAYAIGVAGLAVEASALPRLTLSKLSLESYGVGAKWVASELVADRLGPLFPSIALRAAYTSAGLNFSQGPEVGPTLVDLNTKITQLNVSVSRAFGFIEPYLLLGWLKQSSTISAEGPVSLFSQTATVGASIDVSTSGFQLGVGALVAVWRGAVAAVEYGNVAGVNSYALKLGWRN